MFQNKIILKRIVSPKNGEWQNVIFFNKRNLENEIRRIKKEKYFCFLIQVKKNNFVA